MVTLRSHADATEVTGTRGLAGGIGAVVALRFGREGGINRAAFRAAAWLGGVGKRVRWNRAIRRNFSVAG